MSKITVGKEGDPFLIPVETPTCTFSLQVHELMAASAGCADVAALVRGRAVPAGAADGVPDETLVAVYWQAAGIVQKAAQEGNG